MPDVSDFTKTLQRIKNNGTYIYDERTKKLTVRGALEFPKEILSYSNLIETLDMSHGNLNSLPDDFCKLKNLKVCYLSFNNFTEIPEVFSNCTNLEVLGFKSCKIKHISENTLPTSLRWITLTQNFLTELPKSVGTLKNLQKLLVSGNLLESLPEAMSECENLELIRISANKLKYSPEFLLDLPRLAWYSDSGNHFSFGKELKLSNFPSLDWDSIILKEKIGESAQSTVYKAEIIKTGEIIAVKLYGSEITSDGYPEDDMKASLIAESHPNLISAIGRITGTLNNQRALALRLIPNSYRKLGEPPNAQSVTRDIFFSQETFSVEKTLQILKDISDACAHLHSKNLMHGDIYAHNILTNDFGKSYLGDLGAASFYNSRNAKYEKIDVRGFGYLIDDLINLSEKDESILQKIKEIKDQCLFTEIDSRPRFIEINAQLNSL